MKTIRSGLINPLRLANVLKTRGKSSLDSIYETASSLKLDEPRVRQLNKLSRGPGIPKSVLIRKGIDLVIRHAGEDIISADLRREVDSLVHEDRELLKRPAEA